MSNAKNNVPFFSIVVPIYNVEKYLDDCVKSILAQTFTDFEVILVDDGSPDSCPQLCDAWAKKDNRIRVIHKPNGGLPDARNAGMQQANGKYLVFIDSDDYYGDIHFLFYAADMLQTQNAHVLCYGSTTVLDSTKQVLNRRCEGLQFINQLPQEKRLQWLINNDVCSIAAWLHVVERKFAEEHALYFDVAQRTAEDIEWFFRLLAYEPTLGGLNSTAYQYRVRENSICTSAPKSGSWKMRYMAIEKGCDTIKHCNVSNEYKNEMYALAAYHFYVLLSDIANEPVKAERKYALQQAKKIQFPCKI